MFERYTERARRVVFFARYEASQLGSGAIETEHLLLGLIREGKGLTSRLFAKSRLSMDQIRKDVEGRSPYREKVSTSLEIPLSSESKRVLAHAAEEAERMLHNYIGTEHILLGLMREEKSVAAGILGERGMRLAGVREDILALLSEKATAVKSKETPILSEFSRDLTEAAARNALDPLVGREDELERVIQVLCRRTRNNPVLIGEPGVGKTALVEGLANKIVQGDVPVYLADKRVLALDISLIVAGTKYRGQFEERLKTIMRELTETPNIIIFIDELHTLVGAGSAEGSLDAANILKPALSRGEIQCIGATTPAEYRKHIEKDRALERRFQAVKVASPTEEETVEILRGVKERYEQFHNVAYLDEAIEAAVYQSSRYITDRFLPDKAIDLIDEAGSRVKLREAAAPVAVPQVQGRLRVVLEPEAGSARAASSATRTPGAQGGVRVLTRAVGARVRGQAVGDQGGHRRRGLAVDRDPHHLAQGGGVGEAAAHGGGAPPADRLAGRGDQRGRARHPAHAGRPQEPEPARGLLPLPRAHRGGQDRGGARPRRLPLRQRAQPRPLRHVGVHGEALGEQADRLAARLRGARGGGQLTERVKRNPYCVVLLDEIEKAHPDTFNVLLQVFEDGQLTDGLGNTVDFKNTILIMTSNIGARFIEKKGRMGFASGEPRETERTTNEMVMGEVKRTFNPEFLNRVDEIIIFDALTDPDLVKITRLLVEQLNQNLKEKGIVISIRDEAVEWLLGRTLADRSYGARPLRRAIQRHIEDALSEAFIRGQIRGGRPIEVGVKDGGLWYQQGEQGGGLSS